MNSKTESIMSSLTAKLTHIDYRKLARVHAEKFAVGLIGIFVGLILFAPLLTGKFKWYDKTPQQLSDQAQRTKEQILLNLWPDDEKQKYLNTEDLWTRLSNPTQPVLSSRSIEIAPPLYPRKKLSKEPHWMKVEKLHIVAERSLFRLQPKQYTEAFPLESDLEKQIERNEEDAIVLDQENAASEVPLRYRRRTGIGTRGSTLDALHDADSIETELADNDLRDDERGEGQATIRPFVEGRGFRYALMTGVFNIRAQRELIADALGIPETALNSRMAHFDILGFEVARKTGPGPWLKVEKHQILDINNSIDVLQEMIGFDYDPIDYSVAHPQITSPLPLRIVGEWDDNVAHPDISKFMINTPDGRALKEFLNSYLIRLDKKNATFKKLVEKKYSGFSQIQSNMSGLIGNVFSSRSNIQDLFQSMQINKGRGYPENSQIPGVSLDALRRQQIKSAVNRITAAGTLFLFPVFRLRRSTRNDLPVPGAVDLRKS